MNMQQVKHKEDKLKKQIAELTPEQQKHYFFLEQERLKKPGTYGVLKYFFLGGLHHFYLGKTLFGMINLIMTMIGIVFIQSFGWILFVFILIAELPKLFKGPVVVQKYNNKVMATILDEVKKNLE